MTSPTSSHTPQLGRPQFLNILILFCVSVFLSAGSSFGAEIYGRIRGTITDPTGAVVSGAEVSAINLATGLSKQVSTQLNGSFELLGLPVPGTYNVTAQKGGFKTFTAQGLPLSLNQIYVLNIHMELGPVTQQVTVKGAATQVETTSMQLGMDILGITDIPLNGRDWILLQQTLPGAVAPLGQLGPDNVSMNGNREQANDYMVNGIDANDLPLNSPLVVPNPDAIAEVRVITNTINPEYGRNSGAILNAITKSGTNEFHGDLFEFYRDNALNSRNFFQPDRTVFHRNQFGATLGGPIRRNRTFFFLSFQGSKQRRPETVSDCGACSPGSATVFTPAQRNGAFPDLAQSSGVSPVPLVGEDGTLYPAGTQYSTLFPTGRIPSVDFNPITNKLVNQFVPLPNFGPTTYAFNPVVKSNTYQWITRIDHNFSTKDSLSAYWFIAKTNSLSDLPFFGADLPGFAEVDRDKINQMSLSWNHTFSPSVLNEARIGYNRLNYVAVNPAQPVLPSSYGFTGINSQSGPAGAGLPMIPVTGLFSLGFSDDGPQPRIDQTYHLSDNLSAVKGRHTMKFGFEMRRAQVFNPFYFYNNGQFGFGGVGAFSTGNAGADFLLGIPDSYGQDSGGVIDARAQSYYSYAQDQFKIRRNLTLTYGLGWQINTPIKDIYNGGVAVNAFRAGEQSVIFPTAPVGLVFPGDSGVQQPATYRTIYNHVAPRIGFAWGFADRWSLRGGYGIYYNIVEEETQLQNLVAVPFSLFSTGAGDAGAGTVNLASPYSGYALSNTGTVTPVSLNNKFPFTPPPAGSNVDFSLFEPFSLNVFSPNYTVPSAQNFNLTLEHELPGSAILSVAYVGSLGRHLENKYEINPAGQSPGVNPQCAADPFCVAVRSFQGFYYPQNFRYDSRIFGSIGQQATDSNSAYNSLQISVNKHLSKGLQFLAAYTYSHSIDDSSSFDLSGTANPFDLRGSNRGNSAFDARQRFVLSYIYQIPSIRSLSLLGLGRLPHPLTDGWAISGVSTFQQGFPIQFTDSDPRSLICNSAYSKYGCPDRPDVIAPVQEVSVRSSSLVNSAMDPNSPLPAKDHYFFDPNSFAREPIGQLGNAGRNFFHGPGIVNTDFALLKNTRITEKSRMQLRVEFFNFFNHTQFNNPIGDINSGNFGRVLSAAPSRIIQLGAKFMF